MDLNTILNTICPIRTIGELNKKVSSVLPAKETEGQSDFLTWISDKNSDQLHTIKNGSVIVSEESANAKYDSTVTLIIVTKPRLAFKNVLTEHFIKKKYPAVSAHAVISKSAIIGKNCSIGNHVVIKDNCRLGDNCRVDDNTVINEDSIIGNDVVIGANCTIGGIGFGYEKDEDGLFELIPHIGNVVISDSVDIGNNTCIDRAVLGSTKIESNVKIDNLVHIAHGVHVGKNSVVIANSMVAGSVKIGQNSWIAPSSCIKNGLLVGDNALIGLGAVVIKDVDTGAIVIGNPAKALNK